MDVSVIKVSIRGNMPGGEVWSVNPVYSISPPSLVIDEAGMNAAALAVRAVALPAELKQLLSSAADVGSFRLEGRSLANKLQVAAEVGAPGGSVGGTGVASKTYQTALVCSLLTGLAGASRRGRVYWPALGCTINSGLRLSSPTPIATATAMATYLKNIQTAIRTVGALSSATLVVYSTTKNEVVGVTEISVGDVLDTQRRRRDKAIETRVAAAYI